MGVGESSSLGRRIQPLWKLRETGLAVPSPDTYVFSVFDECLPLPARYERGEGRGGGSPNSTRRCSLLSPALSSLRAGEENSATLNAYELPGYFPFSLREINGIGTPECPNSVPRVVSGLVVSGPVVSGLVVSGLVVSGLVVP